MDEKEAIARVDLAKVVAHGNGWIVQAPGFWQEGEYDKEAAQKRADHINDELRKSFHPLFQKAQAADEMAKALKMFMDKIKSENRRFYDDDPIFQAGWKALESYETSVNGRTGG